MFLVPIRRTLLALVGLCFPAAAAAGDRLAGPYLAAVERIIDGDTLAVRVTVWLGHDIRVLVRVRGVDAPELRGECESEEAQAAAAAVALARLVEPGPVSLTNIEGDKYFGRVLADVRSPKGVDIGAALLQGGYARPYKGGRRGGWCAVGALENPTAEVAQAAPQR